MYSDAGEQQAREAAGVIFTRPTGGGGGGESKEG